MVTIAQIFEILDVNIDGLISREEMRGGFMSYEYSALRLALGIKPGGIRYNLDPQSIVHMEWGEKMCDFECCDLSVIFRIDLYIQRRVRSTALYSIDW